MDIKNYRYTHHMIRVDDYSTLEKQGQARLWCREHFGEEYTERWGLFIDGFNFSNEKDYIWFLLKWA